ncbi:MAG: radical SAM protein [Clostridia bacterium]|nr:radical SAM protein [Clostridia bacterium]
MHFTDVKGILSQNNGMNIYRGCSHGCIYCDSRSKCYNFTHDFEDIEVKRNAPELLEKALKSKRKKCMIGTGSMCDPYLHIEKELKFTRKCLEIIDRHEFGVSVITKSTGILRDMDLYKSINEKAKAVIQMTLTTFDEELCRIIEPNVSTTRERFEALMKFKEEGIPTVVWLCRFLPFINVTEDYLNGILDCCIEAGVKGIVNFGMGVTMREGNREYFYKALDKHFPGLKRKYIQTYGYAYELPSPNAYKLMNLFVKRCEENGIMHKPDEIFGWIREYPQKWEQMSLF